MHISLSLCLPRDELSIPICRHVCKTALRKLNADEDDIGDIEVAITEACTNVLDHSGPGDEYEVQIEFNPNWCVIRVIDTGRGFDSDSLGDDSDLSSERGRGIQLMRHLVDRIKLTSKPEAGTVVHLEKRLAFPEDSPIHRLAAGSTSPGGTS